MCLNCVVDKFFDLRVISHILTAALLPRESSFDNASSLSRRLAPRTNFAPVRTHEQSGDGRDFVRGAGATGWGERDHAPVAFTTRTGEFILRERRHDDAGADRVDPRPTLAPPHRLGGDTQRIAAL